MLLFHELIAALGTRDFNASFVRRRPETFAALGAGKHLMLQSLLNFRRVEANDELAVDLEGGNPHDLLCNKNFSCIGVLGDIPFAVGDVLF